MGGQFASAMEMTLRETFATPDGYSTLTRRWFEEMFTAKSNAAVVASVVERAERLPRSLGEKLLLDMLRYDVGRLTTSLADLRVPVMALQTTYSNEQRERRPMSEGADNAISGNAPRPHPVRADRNHRGHRPLPTGG